MNSARTAYGSRPPPEAGFELWTWLFMRISGVLLVLLALGHLWIMHILNSVHTIDFDFVAARYGRLLWRAYDGTMLGLALLHGMNGARVLVDDYLSQKPGWRRLALWVLGLAAAALFLLGAAVVIFFRAPSG